MTLRYKRRRFWTPRETECLVRLYPDTPTARPVSVAEFWWLAEDELFRLADAHA